MAENNGRLPAGWTSAALSDVATINMGQSPPSSTYNECGDGLPFFQGKAEFGSLYAEAKVWCSRPNKMAQAEDILLSVRAPVGPTNLAPSLCCIGRGLAAVRPEPGFALRYVLYALRRFAADLDAKGTGTTFKAVSGQVVRDFPLPIAPTSEQERIADALDELLSDLDAGVTALERVRDKLKLYRAAVLKAAVEGALTAEWRNQHPQTESASELLKRILAERRRRWEEEELRKFKEKGREWPKNWKAKYKEPVEPDTNELPPLPERWCWASVDQLAILVTDGDHNPPKRVSFGIAHLTAKNVKALKLYIDGCTYVSPEDAAGVFRRYRPLEGDLIVTCVGTVGRTAIVPPQFEFSPDRNLAAVRFSSIGPLARYVQFFLESPSVQSRMAKASGSTAQPHLYLGDIRDLPVALAGRSEQEAIVESVEDQLSIIEHLEADLNAKLNKAHALRQSILRHAFSGELVSQDPNDEPASALLKRIAAEREQLAREAATARRLNGRSRAAPRKLAVTPHAP
jgi:type I restriction enzyme, S subunit